MFYNTEYGSYENAAQRQDGLAAISVLLKVRILSPLLFQCLHVSNILLSAWLSFFSVCLALIYLVNDTWILQIQLDIFWSWHYWSCFVMTCFDDNGKYIKLSSNYRQYHVKYILIINQKIPFRDGFKNSDLAKTLLIWLKGLLSSVDISTSWVPLSKIL